MRAWYAVAAQGDRRWFRRSLRSRWSQPHGAAAPGKTASACEAFRSFLAEAAWQHSAQALQGPQVQWVRSQQRTGGFLVVVDDSDVVLPDGSKYLTGAEPLHFCELGKTF